MSFVLSVLLVFAQAGAQPAQPAAGRLDTAAIAARFGREGQASGDVYKVSFPRSDLKVTVGTLPIRAGLALGSWLAFRLAGANDAIVHGDLVLLQNEVNPVISKLEQGGIEITAVHNHLLHETPRVMYVHVWGRGDAAAMATSLAATLRSTATPMGPVAAPKSPEPTDPGLEVDRIQQALGLKGTVKNGVLSVTAPRPEKISMMGVELPPSMGMATSLNFQAAPGGGGRTLATGDFVLLASEVNPVARVLRENNIAVTALHNHMLHGDPELYFMHFWADGDAAAVGKGLAAAIALVKH